MSEATEKTVTGADPASDGGPSQSTDQEPQEQNEIVVDPGSGEAVSCGEDKQETVSQDIQQQEQEQDDGYELEAENEVSNDEAE